MLLILGILLFVCSFGIILVNYQREANNQDNIFLSLNETVKTTAAAAVDPASRVQEGEVFLDEKSFETETTKKLQRELASTQTAEEVRYTYLRENTGGVKAVRVKMKAGGKWYQTTYAFDIQEGL
ncbi:hypothetical protein [Enterococcus rivorum]|nr:hypothetical protein [Enterococcus rivorum]